MPPPGTLPANLPYPPIYAKVNPADAPILTLALTSDTVPIDVVSDAADTLLQPKLSRDRRRGHASPCRVGCGRRCACGSIRRGSPPTGCRWRTCARAVANANVNGAKGGFDGPRLAFALGANDQLVDAAAYRNLVIAWRNSAPVRLSDVGDVVKRRGERSRRRLVQRPAGGGAGHPAPAGRQHRADGAAVKAGAAARCSAAHPVRDQAHHRHRSHRDHPRLGARRADHADHVGACWWWLVIFLFLRSLRATFIPAIALPLSLVGTFGVMQQLGYALDNLSLMALTIATGFVVDDAIVMIENIVRYIEQGMRPLEAAYRGAAQIGFTIVSLTVSLIAVFIPLLFMAGVVGRLFTEFSVTLVGRGDRLGGGLADPDADDVRPAAATGERRSSPGCIARISEAAFDALLAGYRRSLRLDACGASALVLLVAPQHWSARSGCIVVVPKGFLPQQDTGVLIAVTEAAQNVSIPRLVELQTESGARSSSAIPR